MEVAQEPEVKSANRVVKTSETLEYRFTDDEMKDLSKKLARACQDLQLAEEGKAKVMADLKAQLQSKENELKDLSRLVNNGYEYRSTECELRYHSPEQGLKTLVRLDSGEVVRTVKMDRYEMQEELFSEKPEAEAEAIPTLEEDFLEGEVTYTGPPNTILADVADQMNKKRRKH